MHGIIKPISPIDNESGDRRTAILEWIKHRRVLFLVVVIPTFLAAAYYYLIASDQYASETHFVVRSASSQQGSTSGLGALLGFGAGLSQNKSDAMSVIDYLDSTEAVTNLDRRIGLANRFNLSEADVLSRLRPSQPTPETLLKYYRKQVKIKFDDETGVAEVSVRAFRPRDSLLIAETLLRMGEERVNMLNRRSYRDALATATRQLSEAENDFADLQVRMTRFRQSNSDIDPEGSGKAQTTLVTQMTGNLASAKAQLQAMQGFISSSSPQYKAQAARVRAMESQIASQSARLTGRGSALVNRLGDYEELRVRQQFAAHRYEAAAATYQTAREDARKKRLYLVRVVNPNLPVKSLFPERGRIVLTIFISLLAAYAIGWLLVAGVREHENA